MKSALRHALVTFLLIMGETFVLRHEIRSISHYESEA